MARKKLSATDYQPALAAQFIACDAVGCQAQAFAKSCTRNLCLEHYGQPEEARKRQHLRDQYHGQSYRERWYAERGLPYEPPRLRGNAMAYVRPPARMREPGED